MSLKIGDLAPDFKLFSKNTTGEPKEFALSDYKGKKVVILFYPLSYTGVCTTEMCTISEGFEQYSALNAVVLGISVDSIFTQEAWAKANGITIPLLSDFNAEVCAKYGAKYDNFVLGMKSVAKRSGFVVDKDGKIAYAEVLEDAGKLPDFDKIKEVLKSLN
ncbi:MAG: redoxin domain-containing protein [Ignavibacteria bacterium]|jgi:peroxiredoxin|nr:redoxin domain-containing protein [Ignavibacteria bacterium]